MLTHILTGPKPRPEQYWTRQRWSAALQEGLPVQSGDTAGLLKAHTLPQLEIEGKH